MTMDPLVRAWLLLCALIAASAIVAQFSGAPAIALLAAFAFFKARTILGEYLHLSTAPGWLRAACAPLAIWLALLAGLYTI